MEKINLKGLVEYQNVDKVFYDIEQNYRKSEVNVKFYDVQAKVQAVMSKIVSLSKESQDIIKSIEQSGTDIENELEANGKLFNNFDKFTELEEVSLECSILTELDGRIERAEKDINGQKRRLEAIVEDLKTQSDILKKGLEYLDAVAAKRDEAKIAAQKESYPYFQKLKAMEPSIDPKALLVYKALRKAKGMPVVVELQNGCCCGCGMDIAIEMSNIASGEASECPNCGRIVYKA